MRVKKKKVLGISFSSRQNGNCSNVVDFILDQFSLSDFKIDKVDFSNLAFNRCGPCGYYCFSADNCIFQDSLTEVYQSIIESDVVVTVIPVYCGNLASNYYAFNERLQGFFKGLDIEDLYFKKLRVIIICNPDHEMENELFPISKMVSKNIVIVEPIVLSSRAFGLSALKTELVQHHGVQEMLKTFVEQIVLGE